MAATELIKRIRTVATSEGLEKLVADLRAGASANTQFSESGNVVSITTARLSREQLSAANAFEATRKRVDEAYRNFVRYRTEVANVARAVSRGRPHRRRPTGHSSLPRSSTSRWRPSRTISSGCSMPILPARVPTGRP